MKSIVLLVSSHPSLLCTYIQYWKEKNNYIEKHLCLRIITASFKSKQILA